MILMYAIANCDTVKKARSFLEKKKIDYTFVDFKKNKPSIEHIKRWAAFMGELPANKRGLTYKKYKEEYESLTDSKKIAFLIENTSMIKRPILEQDNQTLAVGFEEEQYKKLNL